MMGAEYSGFLSKKFPITEKLVVNQLYPLVNKTVYTGIKK